MDIYSERNFKKAKNCWIIVPTRSILLHSPILTRFFCSIKINMRCFSQAHFTWSCRHPGFFFFFFITYKVRIQSRPRKTEVHLRSVPVYSQFSGVAAFFKREANFVFWLSILNWSICDPLNYIKSPVFFMCMLGFKLLINLCCGNTSRRESAGCVFVMSRWFQLEIAMLTWL